MSSRKQGTTAPIKLMWNNSIGEGWLLFDNDWNQNWDDMTKLDMLKDVIALLEKEYSETVDAFFEESETL